MPKQSKQTKMTRDLGVIGGIRKFFARLAPDGELVLEGESFTAESLASIFEEHANALKRVDELTIARAQAVALERKLEARLRGVYRAWTNAAISLVGKNSPRMYELGATPHRKWRMSAESKARANDRRQKTRKALGIMGKKQRAALKRKLRKG